MPNETADAATHASSRRAVRLAGETDFEGFRRAARDLLASEVPPDAIDWAVADRVAPGLFDDPAEPSPPPAGAQAQVPADFIALCRELVLHSEPQRFTLVYRLLWRLQREPALRHDPLDADLVTARHMAQSVRRDIHKMKAFVRFREVPRGAGEAPLHVAWFEPQHHIVEAAAPFFMQRFANLRWAILTPARSVRWDGLQLHFGPGGQRSDAPAADAGEALWLTYYEHIFNPARLKLRAMEREMPRRYWHNLPEAVLISSLSERSARSTGEMVESAGTEPARRLPAATFVPLHAQATTAPAVPAADRATAWAAQRSAVQTCRDCPIGLSATQAVFGEGPLDAPLMLVGEQPGDIEDLRGRPFVGPAGELLARVMARLGWPRDAVYLSNAVKHFKYELRGKRRMHKTAAQREADACLHWLESEIVLVQPKAIVALGATAARQLLGHAVAVTSERGRWFPRADGRQVLVTLHPSALLRAVPGSAGADIERWTSDLALAGARAGLVAG